MRSTHKREAHTGRRAALGAMAAMLADGFVATSRAAVGEGATSDVAPLDPALQIRRTIPRTSESIPVIGLGTWQSFDVAGDARGLADAREALRLFHASGARVIDSSPMYGSSRMRAARIDLMQIHNLVDWRTHLETLRAWKGEGRIRYLGFTHYTVSSHPEIASLMRRERPDFVQIDYSVANRDVEREVLPVAQELGVGVLVNQPFESGRLFSLVKGRTLPSWAADIDCASWAQFFLKFVVAHPAVTCAIPATREPRHLVDNLHGGIGRLPDRATRERMAAHIASL